MAPNFTGWEPSDMVDLMAEAWFLFWVGVPPLVTGIIILLAVKESRKGGGQK